MTSPTFVVAGAARAGTTAITEALRRHPESFVTSPKEPHYFAFAGEKLSFTGPGDAQGINATAVTGRDDYLALYRDAGGLAVRGEGSVTTLYYYKKAITEIERVNADMRVVIVLRDPVERAYSSYQYLRGDGREGVADFTEALKLEPERIAAGWHHLWHYVGMSHYPDAVAAFLDRFDNAVHVVFYDDLVRDAAATLSGVYRHLGLNSTTATSSSAPHVNASGQPRSHALQRTFSVLRRNVSVRQVVRHVVPYRTRERLRNLNLVGTGAPPDIRALLEPVFAPDLAELRSVLGRELPPWGYGRH